MSDRDDGRGEPWPNWEEQRRWEVALADVVRRLREERGVHDPARVTADSDALWVEYGDLRVVVAGAAPDVLDPEELFKEVDTWVAFDRIGGPGLVLDRDRAAIAEWRHRLPALQRFWQGIARRVFADVEATTPCAFPGKSPCTKTGRTGGPASKVGSRPGQPSCAGAHWRFLKCGW
jgi:hypothetical protein